MGREDESTWRQSGEVPDRRLAVSARAGMTTPGLTILWHPEVRRIGERAALIELASGRQALLSRREPEFSPPGEALPKSLAIPYLSRNPLRLEPAPDGGVRLNGDDSPISVVADGEIVSGSRSFSASEVERGVVLLLAGQVVLLLHRFVPVFPAHLRRYGLVGASDALLEVCRQIGKVADLDVPVLLRGATGTGKELVAQALHQAGSRSGRPYLAVNLGAIPPSLAAAELFGAVKGAFTGAEQARRGFFRRAQGGTLFLDEIGETPQEVQPMLLRALESGEIQPLGSEEAVRVDVRVVAATDADLGQAVAAGRFRAPLLHRLSGYEIRLPALGERRDDIGRLLLHFLRRELSALGDEQKLTESGAGGGPWLPAPVVARLALAPWPGNVRQLRNVARHLVVDSRGGGEVQITPRLERLLSEGEAPAVAAPAERKVRRAAAHAYRSPQEVTEKELRAALKKNRWHPGATARQLGISRPSLYLLLDSFPQTRKAADLSREEIERASERCHGCLRDMVELLEVSEAGIKRRIKQLGLR